MRLRLHCAVLALGAIGVARAADEPRFDVASLKQDEHCVMNNSIDPGRVSFNGDPLKVLLAEAFATKADQVVGPSWLDTECYTLSATLPEGATKDQVSAMLRSLFTERLKLSSHKDSRPEPGYELVVDKNGPKVKPSEKDSSARPVGQVSFGFNSNPSVKGATTMAFLARRLSTVLRSPVVDLTGLKGVYDIDLAWAPDAGPDDAAEPAGGSIFTAVRESLGLRLQPHKENVDTFVIDHIEHLPTEN